MLAAAVLAATAALAPTYVGQTDEGRRIVVETKRDKITLVHVAFDSFECEQFGNIAPIRVHLKPHDRVGSDGKVRSSTGAGRERLTLNATLTSRRASGNIRFRGTIATGQKCTTRTLRFSAAPRP